MSREAEREMLTNFFSAYFHEDWQIEAESPDAVVRAYAKVATAGHLRALSVAILNYIELFETDERLEESLSSELGSYYLPSFDRHSAKVWLRHVASLLREAPT